MIARGEVKTHEMEALEEAKEPRKLGILSKGKERKKAHFARDTIG